MVTATSLSLLLDNFDSAAYLNPSLTTMNYQRTSVGEEAGKGILALIDGKKFTSVVHHPQFKAT